MADNKFAHVWMQMEGLMTHHGSGLLGAYVESASEDISWSPPKQAASPNRMHQRFKKMCRKEWQENNLDTFLNKRACRQSGPGSQAQYKQPRCYKDATHKQVWVSLRSKRVAKLRTLKNKHINLSVLLTYRTVLSTQCTDCTKENGYTQSVYPS